MRSELHFCRLFVGDDWDTALARHEHYLCARMCIQSNQLVLVIGCGVGDIPLELARYANVGVVAVDPDIVKVSCLPVFCRTSLSTS